MEKPENRLISPFFTRYSGEKRYTPDTIHMTTASPDSKNAPDTAPDDMKPPLPNLLTRGVQSAQQSILDYNRSPHPVGTGACVLTNRGVGGMQ